MKLKLGHVMDPWTSAFNRVFDKGPQRIGSLVNNISGQTESFEKSQQATWDMWNANNSYNSPEHLMELYKQAGLNPNLVSGSAGSHAYASGSAPSMSAGGASVLSAIASFFGMGADLALKGAQTSLVDSQARHLDAQTDLLNQEYNEYSNNGTSRGTPTTVRLTKYATDIAKSAGEGLSGFIQDNFSNVFDYVVNSFDKNVLGMKDSDYYKKYKDKQRKIKAFDETVNYYKKKYNDFIDSLPFSY